MHGRDVVGPGQIGDRARDLDRPIEPPARQPMTARTSQASGGEFEVLEAEEDPVETVLSFAYQQHVTQIVVGESVRSRWQEVLRARSSTA